MHRTFRLFAALLVVALSATIASSARAADATAAKVKNKVTVKVMTKDQESILNGGLQVKLKAKAKKGKKAQRRKVKVRAASKTFDAPHYAQLAKPKTVKVKDGGKRTVTLKLTADGKSEINSCTARTIRVRGKGSRTQVDLTRNTGDCKPQPIDLSKADECDFIGNQDSSRCLLPFPDDYYTAADPNSSTGRRIDLKTAATPANSSGVHIAGAAYAGNDGFSPGQTMVVRVPGLDTPQAFAQTGAVPLSHLGQYSKKDAPIVVIDADTGQRWPIWVEIDSNASTAAETAMLIHPAKNFASGDRYIVAMRNLKNAGGTTLSAPEGFRYYRDDLPSDEAQINAQRSRFDSIFKTLRSANIQRSNLYLAWDFTVATDENIAKNILAMRDDAFAQLGDTNLGDNVVQGSAPSFTVTSVQDYQQSSGGPLPQDSDMARRVQGTFQVPCYMKAPAGGNPCDPGSTLNLDANGVPKQNGMWTANFNCMIPYAALTSPARPQVYGHGLLGTANEATSSPQKTLGNAHDMMDCSTDEIGMADSDIINTIGILKNMNNFPQLADRLQQGMLNGLYLGRLLDNDDGFVTDPAFRVDAAGPVSPGNPPVIDTSRLYYNGNSQGAIFGGALTAVSPDFTRASLGVAGMNYSVLLNRSVDFDTYAAFLDPAYPDEISQQLVLSMVQMLWDRGESNGYARVMTGSPLPDTPAHQIILNVGVGDHQVTNFSAETEARTIGAKIHSPIVYYHRWPNVNVGWGISPISSYPYSGSALVYWDSGPIRPDPSDPSSELGTNVPPIANVPNRDGADPHELPRRTPEEQQMVSDFLQPPALSHITDTCGGGPCFDFTFPGP